MKPNGFLIFATEYQKKMASKGNFVSDINKVMLIAAPHWEKLDMEEREKFKAKSKLIDSKKKKKNCSGESVEVIEEKDENARKNYDKMINDIKELIVGANERGELDSLVLYFISTSSFHVCESEIFPAELAMAKFSLKEGIFEEVQVRINPGSLPVGSRLSAQEMSNTKHKYPLPPDCKGETDYFSILETIIKFLHPMDKLPIFFAEGNTRDNSVPLNETRRVISKIFIESQEDDVLSELKIYPIEELFFFMQRFTVMNKNRLNDTNEAPFPSLPYASNEFRNETFDHLSRGCSFHNVVKASESCVCCLAKVRTFGYKFIKWCASRVKYELHAGKHYPEGLELVY